MIDHGLQRAGLGEEMAGARDDFQGLRSAQSREGLPVELDNHVIGPADDQQRRCVNLGQDIARKIGASAARDDRADAIAKLRRRDERRRRPCA